MADRPRIEGEDDQPIELYDRVIYPNGKVESLDGTTLVNARGEWVGDVDAGSVDTDELNNATVKHPSDSFQTTLAESADNGKPLVIAPGLHTESRTTSYTKDNDVAIYLHPLATLKNNGFNDEFLIINTTESVTLAGPGRIDLNQEDRTATVASEIDIANSSDVYVGGGLRIVENIEFALSLDGISNATVEPASVNTSAGAAGADGIHIYSDQGSVDNVTVRPGTVHAGDDAVAVIATANDISNVSIEGGVLESDVGDGVVVEIRSGAASSTQITDVDVGDVTVRSADTDGVKVRNNRDASRDLSNITVDADVKEAVQSGANGVNAEHVAGVMEISGSVANIGNNGVRCLDCESPTVDISGSGIGESGVLLDGCDSGYISGALEGGTGSSHGVVTTGPKVSIDATIRGFGSNGVLLDGSAATDCRVGGVIEDNGGWGVRGAGSDHNLVDGAVLRGNTTGAHSLDGTNSLAGDVIV